MSDDHKLIMFLFACLAATVCVIVAAWNINDYWVKHEAMKSGYSQQSIPGVDGVYWVKDGKSLGQAEAANE